MKKKTLFFCLLDKIESLFRSLEKIVDVDTVSMADWDRMILIQNQIFPLLEILGKSSGITVTKSLLKRLKRIKEYASWSAVAAHLDHIVDHHLGDDKEA